MIRYLKCMYSIILQIFLMLFICISLSHAMPKKDGKEPTFSTASEASYGTTGACKSIGATSQNDDYHDIFELCKYVEQEISQQKINLFEDFELLKPLVNHWFEIGMVWQMSHHILSKIKSIQNKTPMDEQ